MAAKLPERSFFDPYIRKYFLHNSEEILAKEIVNLSKKGIQITENTIRQLANQYYHTPWILAERCAYQTIAAKGKSIYKDDKKNQLSDEFLELAENIKQKIENLIDKSKTKQKSSISTTGNPTEDDEDLKQQKREEDCLSIIIKSYNLPHPIFSSTWVNAFLKRNRLSWRKAHFARRGKIDKTYVKIFINELARAVVLYGWNRVYNIDETSIRINNGSMRTVAPIRTEEVIVDKARNEKECFTAIGCCTRCEALPLVIVSKGKTDQSKLKCNVDNKETILLTKNSNGWTNEDVMLQYLEFFRKNIVGKDDCALVLDCLAAHRTPAVLNKAAELRIDLIFVPANGTGYYQPLDRRIFGILKSKLRSITGTQCLSGESRYSTITKYLMGRNKNK